MTTLSVAKQLLRMQWAYLPLILVGSVALTYLTATSVAGSKRPEITFRIHTQAGNEIREDQTVPIGLIDPEEFLRVHKLAFVSERQVAAVMPTSQGGALIQLNQVGTSSLQAATSTELGKTLVVFLNGRVVYAAVIDIPINSGRLLIPAGIAPEEIQALKAFIEQNKKL
ncbi:MAG: hypothetical protein ACFCUX_03335 [Candidatus Methylacidiphilales bacterium]